MLPGVRRQLSCPVSRLPGVNQLGLHLIVSGKSAEQGLRRTAKENRGCSSLPEIRENIPGVDRCHAVAMLGVVGDIQIDLDFLVHPADLEIRPEEGFEFSLIKGARPVQGNGLLCLQGQNAILEQPLKICNYSAKKFLTAFF